MVLLESPVLFAGVDYQPLRCRRSSLHLLAPGRNVLIARHLQGFVGLVIDIQAPASMCGGVLVAYICRDGVDVGNECNKKKPKSVVDSTTSIPVSSQRAYNIRRQFATQEKSKVKIRNARQDLSGASKQNTWHAIYCSCAGNESSPEFRSTPNLAATYLHANLDILTKGGNAAKRNISYRQ